MERFWITLKLIKFPKPSLSITLTPTGWRITVNGFWFLVNCRKIGPKGYDAGVLSSSNE